MKSVLVQILLGCLLYVVSPSVADIYPTCNTEIICNAHSVSTDFKRHPTDCAKSYKCKNGALKIFTCPEGQHFSTDLQACMIPPSPECHVQCFEMVPMEETTTEAVPEDCSEEVPDEIPEENPEEETLECVFSRCPDDWKHPVYLPHQDCSKYCVCENHSIHTLECSPGLHFSPHQKVCDWPVSAGCETSNLKLQHLPTLRI